MDAVICVMLVVIATTIIGAVTQVMKNAQQPPGGAANRPAGGGGGARTSSNDIDRFLEEIDRLRKKKAGDGEPPVARPVARAKPTAVPVAQPAAPPVRSTRRIEATPPPAGPAFTPTVVQVRELPAANPVVSTSETPQTPQTPRALHRQGFAPTAPRGGSTVTVRARVAPTTDFGRGLTALLMNPQSAAMAVVLQEVLGPPKCRQG